jgi:hypothetical protein
MRWLEFIETNISLELPTVDKRSCLGSLAGFTFDLILPHRTQYSTVQYVDTGSHRALISQLGTCMESER